MNAILPVIYLRVIDPEHSTGTAFLVDGADHRATDVLA
jgi:hypothetical protein